MGSCLSRPPGKGQRLGSSAEQTGSNQAQAALDARQDRDQRAAAAEARLQKERQRGGGDGSLSKKLAHEQRTGGTGNRAPDMPERTDWN
jgi:hypothetical protein